jgi:hypothetical protein
MFYQPNMLLNQAGSTCEGQTLLLTSHLSDNNEGKKRYITLTSERRYVFDRKRRTVRRVDVRRRKMHLRGSHRPGTHFIKHPLIRNSSLQ